LTWALRVDVAVAAYRGASALRARSSSLAIFVLWSAKPLQATARGFVG
jgi:hypothetical protein